MFCAQPPMCRYRDDITRQRVAGVVLIISLMSCLHGSLICQPMKRAGPVQGEARPWVSQAMALQRGAGVQHLTPGRAR